MCIILEIIFSFVVIFLVYSYLPNSCNMNIVVKEEFVFHYTMVFIQKF